MSAPGYVAAGAAPPPRSAGADVPLYLLFFSALAALGLSAQEQWPLVLAMLAAVGLHPLLGGRRLRMGLMGYLFLALPFAAFSRVWEAEGRLGYPFYNTAFYLLTYFLAVTLVRLYNPPHPARTPRCVLATGFIMAFIGTDLRSHEYTALLVVYVAALVAVFRGYLRLRVRAAGAALGRRLAVGLFLGCSLALTLALVFLLNLYHQDLRRLFQRYYYPVALPSVPGFSDEARLGTVVARRNDAAADRVALRAFADAAPGYLRGRVFLGYNRGRWVSALSSRELRPEEDEEAGERLGRLVLPERPAPSWSRPPAALLYPEPALGPHFFLPLSASAVRTASRRVLLYPGGVLMSKYRATARGYEVFRSPAPVRTEAERDSYLALPPSDSLRARLDTVLAAAGAASGLAPPAAVERLREYFARTYDYRFGIVFEEAEADPLERWLDPARHRHGHCELFASAGTLLLRRLGVRARYVTGFICTEKNPYGRMYVARNRHAHAWVEYYRPGAGWTTAEFTPADGVPDGGGGEEGALGEYLVGWWRWLAGLGVEGIVDALLEAVAAGGRWVLGAWWRIGLLVLLLGVYLRQRWRRRGGRAGPSRPPRTFPAEVAALREEYLALERRLRRRGRGRRPGETLLEYAARLEANPPAEASDAAVLVRRLAGLRYSPAASA
jgi:transglutaminase-like putative cysteine protease